MAGGSENSSGRSRDIARRAPALLLAVGLVVWAACAASLDVGHIGVVHDDGIYLASARALRDRLTYELPSRPYEPRPKYPIGLPALIAAALRISPGALSLSREVAVARTLVVSSGALAFLLAYVWLRRVGVRATKAAVVVLAAAFNHVAIIGCASTIFSDLPFCAVVYGLLARWAGRNRDGAAKRAPLDSYVDGMLAGLGVLLRTNGVTLAAGALIAAWLGPRRRASVGACLLGTAMVVVPLLSLGGARQHSVPSGDYSLEMKAGWSSPAAGARIVVANLGSIVRDFPTHVVFPNASYTPVVMRFVALHPLFGAGGRLVISAAVAIGLARLWRGRRSIDAPAWFHGIATLGIFAIWPWNAIMDRFLLPLFPVVLLCFGEGMASVLRLAGIGRPALRHAATAAVTLALASNLAVAGRAVMVFHANGGQWPGASDREDLSATLAHLATLEPDAVVAATWPETVYLYADRQAFPLVEDDQLMLDAVNADRLKLWLDLCSRRPCYLLIRSRAEDPSSIDIRQADQLASDPNYRLREIFRSPRGGYRVMAILRGQRGRQ